MLNVCTNWKGDHFDYEALKKYFFEIIGELGHGDDEDEDEDDLEP